MGIASRGRNVVEERSLGGRPYGAGVLNRPARLAIVAAFFAAVAGLIVYGAMGFVRYQPANINFYSNHRPGTPVNLTIQTVGDLGPGHLQPDWVSYLVRTPQGNWVRSTQWELPSHTRIDVTVYEYDTGSPLRNQFWGKVRGTVGDRYQLTENGSSTPVPVGLVNSYDGNGVAHTFTVPTLDINVPLYGISSTDENACNAAPCLPKEAHNLIKFSFTTPGPGQYRWQCFIPCGVGFLYGNGGPMDTLGYMAGFLKVQPT